MSTRKMSRRAALALTVGAAAGAALLADVQPADATWPTIISPGDVAAAAAAVAGAAAVAAGAAAPQLLQMASSTGRARIHSFQGTEFCGWEDVETLLLAAAAAVGRYKESSDSWKWGKHHPRCIYPKAKR